MVGLFMWVMMNGVGSLLSLVHWNIETDDKSNAPSLHLSGQLVLSGLLNPFILD